MSPDPLRVKEGKNSTGEGTSGKGSPFSQLYLRPAALSIVPFIPHSWILIVEWENKAEQKMSWCYFFEEYILKSPICVHITSAVTAFMNKLVKFTSSSVSKNMLYRNYIHLLLDVPIAVMKQIVIMSF